MQSIIGNSILDQFFDDHTMSVHFKEKVPYLKKIGRPGMREAEKGTEIITKEVLNNLIDQIFAEIEKRDDAFLEIDKKMSKIVQLWPYRIVIVYPPLSDGLEMTVVKPVKKLNMEDYALSQEVLDMIKNKSKGILISGSPWSGKSTFAQALSTEYLAQDKIVKTVESPRDLLVAEEVVQYSFTYGSYSEIRDILLLSRPDYTIYDEVRNTEDFDLYKDLRLTGIGLVGVIHATNPVDGIQRFLGNIEMGIIPQVVDTVIFIDGGAVKEILTLDLIAKVPEGMMSADLARPVIQISSFLTKKLTHEIYSFGEQIVVMPLDKIQKLNAGTKWWATGINALAEKTIKDYFGKLLNCDFFIKIEGHSSVKIYVPESYKGQIIGKNGVKITEIEKKLWISVSVRSFDELPVKEIHPKIIQDNKGRFITLDVGNEYKNQTLCMRIGEELIYEYVNPEGIINISQKMLIKQIVAHGIQFIETN